MAELRGRATQRLHALVERAMRPALEITSAEALAAHLTAGARRTLATPDGWSRGLLGGRFLPGADDLAATTAAATAMDPGFRDWCLDRASRALSGRFDLLGYHDLSWGTPIAWQREPLAGIPSPRVHWSRVRYLDPTVVGDHKLLWELNRHQVLVTFAQAACLTGESRWSEACFGWLEDWMSDNPPALGVNWASSLEVAFRAMAWIWALRLLDRPPPPALAVRIAGHLHHAGRHLERYLSTWFSPNTHLTGEALGLLYLGTQLPQFRDATRWRDLGWGILRDEVERHIQRDGVYFEHATWYHRYTVDFYLHAIVLAERNGLPVPPAMRERLGLALEHLASLTRPDGTMPLIGDDDGGKLAILDGRGARETGAALAQGAVLFGRSDLAKVAGTPGAELAWVLGAEGVAAFRRLHAVPPAWLSRAFPDAGCFVLRDGWDAGSSMMVVDCGAHGALNCGHAHADALAFDLAVQGVAVLVDPGTFTYTAPADRRDAFRATFAHNTVTLDGRSSSIMAGPFQWKRVATVRVERWLSTHAFDFIQGSHDGYEDLPAPATVRRSILFLREHGVWVIRDEVASTGDHEVACTFQAAPGITMSLSAPDRVVCREGARDVLTLVVTGAPEGARVTVERGEVSPAYGAAVEAPVARIRARCTGSSVITTVLCSGDWPEALGHLGAAADAGVPVEVAALVTGQGDAR